MLTQVFCRIIAIFLSIFPVNSLLFLYGENTIGFLLHHFTLGTSHSKTFQDLISSTRRVRV